MTKRELRLYIDSYVRKSVRHNNIRYNDGIGDVLKKIQIKCKELINKVKTLPKNKKISLILSGILLTIGAVISTKNIVELKKSLSKLEEYKKDLIRECDVSTLNLWIHDYMERTEDLIDPKLKEETKEVAAAYINSRRKVLRELGDRVENSRNKLHEITVGKQKNYKRNLIIVKSIKSFIGILSIGLSLLSGYITLNKK